MSKKILTGFAVTLGAGLAFGIGTKLGRSSAARRPNILDLEPLVDRLDNVENRILEVETRFTTGNAHSSGAADSALDRDLLGQNMMRMESRLSAQNKQIDELRREIQTVETRGAHQVLSFNQKLAEVEARLPAEIEANVGERIAALEQKLQADFRQTHSRTVDLFVQTIESKVVQRISALEQSLAEHSNTIVGLREKSLSTDENLQRLLAAVEKLCAQTAARVDNPAEPPDPPATGTEKSFAAHLGRELGQPIPAAEPSRARATVISLATVLFGFLGRFDSPGSPNQV